MNFSTNIEGFNTEFNLNAVKEYNRYLQGQASFEIESEPSEFEKALDTASKAVPLDDKNDPYGMGNFMNQIESSLGGSLNAVNRAKLEADRLQEDLAAGGSTSVHEAMIAAEKADLSLQMAVQIRNRILSAYTEINSMAL